MKKLFKNYLPTVFLALVLLFCLYCNINTKKTVRYSGYGDNEFITYSSVISETVSFTKKEETYLETTNSVPFYTQISDLSNSCGPTGGAIIIGFYDKYYNDLIPDFDPCLSSGRYKKNDRVAVPKLMGELYALMRTNVDDVGVGQGDCIDGLNTYVREKGYSISYSNVRSNYSINATSFTLAVERNEPTLIFCSKMDLYILTTAGNLDSISYTTYNGGHIVVGYGIYEVKYYNGDNVFRSDTYVRVATGLAGVDHGFIKLSSTDWCNAAYAVDIN